MIQDTTQLLEIFKDFEVEITYTYSNKSGSKQRNVRYIIVPKASPKKVTLDDLKEYASGLAKKYPKEGFVLKEEKVGEKTFYVITKDSANPEKPYVPIYFDLENQKFYVPKEYVEKDSKLTNYIVMRTLGALGVSRTSYGGVV